MVSQGCLYYVGNDVSWLPIYVLFSVNINM